MGNHVGAEAPAPGGEPSVKGSQHGNKHNLLGALVGVAQPKHNRLQHHSGGDAAGICGKLFLKITAKNDLLADTGGDGDRNPQDDFNRALRQQTTDGFRLVRPSRWCIARAEPSHTKRKGMQISTSRATSFQVLQRPPITSRRLMPRSFAAPRTVATNAHSSAMTERYSGRTFRFCGTTVSDPGLCCSQKPRATSASCISNIMTKCRVEAIGRLACTGFCAVGLVIWLVIKEGCRKWQNLLKQQPRASLHQALNAPAESIRYSG